MLGIPDRQRKLACFRKAVMEGQNAFENIFNQRELTFGDLLTNVRLFSYVFFANSQRPFWMAVVIQPLEAVTERAGEVGANSYFLLIYNTQQGPAHFYALHNIYIIYILHQPAVSVSAHIYTRHTPAQISTTQHRSSTEFQHNPHCTKADRAKQNRSSARSRAQHSLISPND